MPFSFFCQKVLKTEGSLAAGPVDSSWPSGTKRSGLRLAMSQEHQFNGSENWLEKIGTG